MTELRTLSRSVLEQRRLAVTAQYQTIKAQSVKLDMTRGKPAPQQLDLVRGMAECLRPDDWKAADGTDVRNYGGLDGLPEMKTLFGQILDAPAAQVIVGGNSSLQLMHDTIVRAVLFGVPDGTAPWGAQKTKFLCPTPGYDRHFAICQHLGIEMANVELGADGPDLTVIEQLAAHDPSIRGIWCVPKYSNPTGIVYSAATVEGLARLKTAAPDFRIFWDNAYGVHDLYDTSPPLANLLALCEAAGHPNRPYLFASTSKISMAGAGVAAMASSRANVEAIKRHLAVQTIGPDKMNQLRHVRFYGDFAGVLAHMKKHAAIIRPKFEAVADTFQSELDGKGIAEYTRPLGGYFISLDTLDGCAAKVVRLADEAGVKLTAAGATFPYGRDPRDRNIRIAPTLPPLEQVIQAMQVVAVCVELASIDLLLAS